MCNSSQPRRPILDQRYPELCPFFDGITKEGLAAEVNESFTVNQFFAGLNLNSTDLETLKDQLMLYASDNLVRINAFLDSPYLSKFHSTWSRPEKRMIWFLPCYRWCRQLRSSPTSEECSASAWAFLLSVLSRSSTLHLKCWSARYKTRNEQNMNVVLFVSLLYVDMKSESLDFRHILAANL